MNASNPREFEEYMPHYKPSGAADTVALHESGMKDKGPTGCQPEMDLDLRPGHHHVIDFSRQNQNRQKVSDRIYSHRAIQLILPEVPRFSVYNLNHIKQLIN